MNVRKKFAVEKQRAHKRKREQENLTEGASEESEQGTAKWFQFIRSISGCSDDAILEHMRRDVKEAIL